MEIIEKKNQKKRLGQNLILLLLSLLIIFLVIEGVIRIIKPAIFYQRTIVGWKGDDYKLLTNKSDQFQGYILNSDISLQHKHDFGEYDYLIETGDFSGFGFRKDGSESASDENKIIVWNFGDSFAFGFGVESDKTYSAILSASGFESTNFGQPGFTLWQELELFKELYKKAEKKPEVVTFGIFLGNDITEHISVAYPQAIFQQGTSRINPIFTRIVRRIEYYFDVKSHLYHFLSERSVQLMQRFTGKDSNEEYDFEVPAGYFITNHLLSSSLNSLPYNLLNDFMKMISDFPAEDYPVEFYVLLFPSKEMLLEVKSFPKRRDETNKISEMIRSSFNQQNVNILEYFDDALIADEFWFFPKDTHFNAYGHEMVAMELLKHININNNKQ